MMPQRVATVMPSAPKTDQHMMESKEPQRWVLRLLERYANTLQTNKPAGTIKLYAHALQTLRYVVMVLLR